MPYRVDIAEKARLQLETVPAEVSRRLSQHLDALLDRLNQGGLSPKNGLLLAREVGNFVAVCQFDSDEQRVELLEVTPRALN